MILISFLLVPFVGLYASCGDAAREQECVNTVNSFSSIVMKDQQEAMQLGEHRLVQWFGNDDANPPPLIDSTHAEPGGNASSAGVAVGPSSSPAFPGQQTPQHLVQPPTPSPVLAQQQPQPQQVHQQQVQQSQMQQQQQSHQKQHVSSAQREHVPSVQREHVHHQAHVSSSHSQQYSQEHMEVSPVIRECFQLFILETNSDKNSSIVTYIIINNNIYYYIIFIMYK